MYDIEHPSGTLILGRLGEGNATILEFEVSPWLAAYPAGLICISYKRPGECEDIADIAPHPATGVTVDGTTLRWVVGAHALELVTVRL